MTVTAIMVGLLPIMWSTGTGSGSEIMQRIAVPIIGGMIALTLLTLIVTPAIFGLAKGFGLPSSGLAAAETTNTTVGAVPPIGPKSGALIHNGELQLNYVFGHRSNRSSHNPDRSRKRSCMIPIGSGEPGGDNDEYELEIEEAEYSARSESAGCSSNARDANASG